MSRFLRVILTSVLIAGGAVAAEAPDTKVKPGAKLSDLRAAAERLVDARAPEHIRDPFWPVNYLPAGIVRVKVALSAKSEGRKKALGTLRYRGSAKVHGKYFANVNGTMVKAGDVVGVTVGGRVYKFRVHSIDMNGVKFKSADDE
ncbi:hypothetical protein ACFLQR_02220 [Verrucomicrobiota bacterium]